MVEGSEYRTTVVPDVVEDAGTANQRCMYPVISEFLFLKNPFS